MSKQIKPGMLCIIEGSKNKALNGIIVEVIRKGLNGEYFTNVHGLERRFLNCEWVCTSKTAMSGWDEFDREIGPFYTRGINSSILTPISDPDIELTTEDIKELEND